MNILWAEFIKIKRSLVLPLLLGLPFALAFLIFASSYTDPLSLANFDENPWQSFMHRGYAIFLVFLWMPLLILLITAFMHLDHKANAWKYLYTLPVSRTKLFFAKLIALLLFSVASILFLTLFLFLMAYILGWFYPEFEFAYHYPNYSKVASFSIHGWISILGMIGLQFYLSLRFKNFVIPLGIGMLGVVSGFILTALDTPITLYNPYTLVMCAQDLDMFKSSHRSFIESVGISNFEMNSIVYFLLFIILGWVYATKRSVNQ